MIALFSIILVVIPNLSQCLDLPICNPPQPELPGHKPNNHYPEPEWPKPEPEWAKPEPEWSRPEPPHYPRPYPECGENCRGRHNIKSVVYSPIKLLNVLENVILVCEPSHRNIIKRIESINNRLRYNASCNGVLSGFEKNPGIVYYAVIQTEHGEKSVPLKAKTYRYSANYNMGSEQFSEFADLAECICEGSTLSAHSIWLAENPTQGCCSDGVRKTNAIYYKIEIKGRKCCTVCTLLAADDAYETELHN